MTELASIDHTELDQARLLDQLIDRIPTVAPQWTDRGESDIGRALLELFAFVNSSTLHRLDMTANELFLATARQRGSVIRLANLIGYRVSGYISAVADITFTRSSDTGAEVVIPKFTRMSTEGDPSLDFHTFEEAAITSAETVVNVKTVQGRVTTENFNGNGSLVNQEVILGNQEVAQNGIEVRVGTDPDHSKRELWTEVDDFLNSVAQSKHYTFRFNADEQGVIIFGDGSFGSFVTVGQGNISVRYLRSDGARGNVGVDKITVLQEFLVDANGMETSLTVNNTAGATGGNNPETIESVRINAPAVRSAGGRAVTKEDHVALIESLSTISKANAWGEKELVEDYNEANNPDITAAQILTRGWFNQAYVTAAPSSTTPSFIGTSLKESIANKLEASAIFQVKHSIWHPTYIRIDVDADIHTLRGYSITAVESAARAALDDFFSLSSRNFGQTVHFSNINNLLASVPGVSYLELKIRKSAQILSTVTIADSYEINASANSLIITIDGGSSQTLTLDAQTFEDIGSMVNYLANVLEAVGATAFLVQDDKIVISSLSSDSADDSLIDIGTGTANATFGFASDPTAVTVVFRTSDISLLRHEIATKGNISLDVRET